MTKRRIRSHLVTKVLTHYESRVPHKLCRSKEYTFERVISSQKHILIQNNNFVVLKYQVQVFELDHFNTFL